MRSGFGILLWGFFIINNLNAQLCEVQNACFNQVSPCLHSSCGSSGVRYVNPIFDSLDIVRVQRTYACISDSIDPCADTTAQIMRLDIYYNPNDCECCNKPMIVFVGSGGFHAQDKRNALAVHHCYEYAMRGYVAVSITYRTGYAVCCIETVPFPAECNYLGDHRPYDVINHLALQDVSSAIRYMRSKTSTFGIDSNRIMLVGSSAGGILALHHAYMDEHEVDSAILAENGPFKRYGAQGYSDKVQGISVMWGVMKEHDWMLQDENFQPHTTPVQMYHGTCDGTYHFDRGQYKCFFEVDTTPYLTSGPYRIRQTIIDNSLPICYEVHSGCGFYHGIHRRCSGGSSSSGGYIWEMGRYIIQKTAEFAYETVVDCIPGCVAQDQALCKPCYCTRCQTTGYNVDAEECRGCVSNQLYGTLQPYYLEACNDSNQWDGFILCNAFVAINDTTCDTNDTNQVFIHPVPRSKLWNDIFNERLIVETSTYSHGLWNLSVLDMMGRQVLSKNFEVSGSSQRVGIDISKLPKGIFMAVLESKHNQESFKFYR